MNRLPLWTSLAALAVSVVLLVVITQANIRPTTPAQPIPTAQSRTSSTAGGSAAVNTSGPSSATSSLAASATTAPNGSARRQSRSVSEAQTLLPPAPQPPTANFTAASAQLRAALVNIMCYAPASSSLHSISGSGVIIDSKGIILTNAHVAQYFLLADQGVTCVIRSGSPATDQYEAKLEYLSPAWVAENTGVLTERLPTGTGEHDYALLAITSSATEQPLPAYFPAIPLASAPPRQGSDVVIASYGAQFLNTVQIQTDLFPTVVYGSVKGVFTFATTSVDVLALGGSAAAQEGSSGGGVANGESQLAGLITTSTVTGATASRSLNAITASYIRADYAAQTGSSLEALLAQDPASAVQAFAQQIPALESAVLGTTQPTQ